MRTHDLFISYSRDDRNAAKRIAALLEREGFSVWWDAAIHSGESFDEVIERQLRAAKAAVVLWSPRSVASRWVRAEATLADRRNILVPVLLEPCDLPIIFELTHSIDLSNWGGNVEDQVWRQLVDDISRLVQPNDNSEPAPTSGSRSFLLADDEPAAPASRPAAVSRASPRQPSPQPEPVADAAAETEQTAFYTRADEQRLFGTGPAHYLELGPEEAPLATYPIGPLGMKIGRAAPSDIILDDKRISRRHCEVTIREGELLVEDLHSTNGTFVDGKRISAPTVLAAGGQLKVGEVVLTHRVRATADLD